MKKVLSQVTEKGLTQIFIVLVLLVIIAALGFYLLKVGKLSLPFITPGTQVSPTGSGQMKIADHYDLALFGDPGTDNNAQSGADGATIFLPLSGECTIHLTVGDFKVSDDRCLSDIDASFSLPGSSSGDEGVTSYAVYLRTYDQKMAAAADCKKEADNSYCPSHAIAIVRSQDQSFSSDVTKILENVYLDLAGGSNLQRYNIFDDRLKDKIWQEDRRAVYLRFYLQSQQDLDQEASQQ